MVARLTSLILAALVAAILAPAASASDAQNRVRAFSLAAASHAWPAAAEKSCTRPATTTPQLDLAAGFCVAGKSADGRLARLADETGEFRPFAGRGAASRLTNSEATDLAEWLGFQSGWETAAWRTRVHRRQAIHRARHDLPYRGRVEDGEVTRGPRQQGEADGHL